MDFINTHIEDLIIIEPRVFKDGRGYFYESYNETEFIKNGISDKFVQDNQSLSQKDILRGLHFQLPPYAQAKIVRVIQGSVLDVAVDLRKESNTYGEYLSIELSEKNNRMLYLPEGFAHGFLALEDNTIFSYKCSNLYHKESEKSIIWNDKDLNINWGITYPILSDKDEKAEEFSKFKTPFN